MGNLVSWIAIGVATVTLVAVFYQIWDTHRRQPPGGTNLSFSKHSNGPGTMELKALGAWVYYSPKVESFGCNIVTADGETKVWEPKIHRIDGDNSLSFGIRYIGIESAKVVITWVSGQTRSTVRGGIRYSLDTGKYENLVRYRVPWLHKEPARWVERKKVHE